jgi:hypothetical protein
MCLTPFLDDTGAKMAIELDAVPASGNGKKKV